MASPIIIYSITHVASGRAYIGSTNDQKQRWGHHRGLLNRGVHHCRALQAAWIDHGAGAFAFAVVEKLSDASNAERVAAECRWIGLAGHFNETEPGLRGETFAHGPRVKAVLRRKAIERAADPDARAKLKAGVQAAWDNPGRRDALAERNRQRWAIEGAREAMGEQSRAWMTTEEARARQVENNARLWDNPVYVERMTRLGTERMADPAMVARIVGTRKRNRQAAIASVARLQPEASPDSPEREPQ